MTSMIKADGDLLGFVSRPIAATLVAAALTLWLLPPLIRLARGRLAATR